MSTTPNEPTASTTTAPVPTPPPVAPAAPPVETPPAQETDWKAEARKWEQRAKDNTAAAAKLAEIEEANKTEAQKLADRAAKAEERAVVAERKAFAAEKGIPLELVTGTTPDQWEAAATAALAWRGDAPKPPSAPPASGQGKQGTPPAGQVTEQELESMSPEAINEARRAGRLKNLLGG